MSGIDLSKLRKRELTCHADWKAKGRNLAGYLCGHCGVKRYAFRPLPAESPTLAWDRDYWDSLTLCTSCGDFNFVTVYPDGRTIAKPVE